MAEPFDGYHRLAIAVLARAYYDRHGTNERARIAAAGFLERDSPLLHHWCRVAPIQVCRLRVCTRTPPETRKPYPGSHALDALTAEEHV